MGKECLYCGKEMDPGETDAICQKCQDEIKNNTKKTI